MVTPEASANGSLSPDTPQGVTHGEATTFTVMPNSGYLIDSVSGCGGSLLGNAYTTAPVVTDCTVTATFTQIATHLLGVSVTGQGTVHSAPGTDLQCTDNCAQDYVEGTIVTLSADPASNNDFTGWTGDCTGTGDCIVTMDTAKSVGATFTSTPLPEFTDDFEGGTLENWIIGGRRQDSPNIAEVVLRKGSNMAHLQKGGFSEIELYRDFVFDLDYSFKFDMEVDVTSTSGASNNYSLAGAWFMFMDSSDNILGRVTYAAASTNYVSSVYATDPTKSFNAVPENVLTHYDLAVSDLLSQIDINQNLITKVRLIFDAYSSVHAYT